MLGLDILLHGDLFSDSRAVKPPTRRQFHEASYMVTRLFDRWNFVRWAKIPISILLVALDS
jgi:hypothetical protein